APGDGHAALGPALSQLQRGFVRWSLYSRTGSLWIRGNVIWMKAIPVLSLLLLARRAVRLSRLLGRERKPLWLILGKTLLESWATLELLFLLSRTWKKRSLEARRAYQPAMLWKAPGERMKLLSSFLSSTDRIHAGHPWWRR
ncbi:unnamed protein product, partial [Prorocentrum cordatum]